MARKAFGPFQGSIIGRRLRVETNKGTEHDWRIILAWLDRNEVWIAIEDAQGKTREMKLTSVILEPER